MNEERYATHIRQALNHGLKDISPATARRLEAARHQALARQKQPEAKLVTSGHGWHTFSNGSLFPVFRQVFAIIALLLGMWLSFYWQSNQYSSAIEKVDSALLSDDLPPEAFLDNDFYEWLKNTSPQE